jgi:D-arabinose 1-dehydrogenase-like Zn-dependent alcohol dehydrogenase
MAFWNGQGLGRHVRFGSLTGVRPMIERYPLDKAADAYDQMISGRARFRVVLTMGA